VGNGYANTEADQHTGTGSAQLLIIDAESGTVIRRIDTKAGSAADGNGLSAPRAIDANADGRVDYAYAGDLHGNLWRFDLRGASSGWSVSFNGSPLYSARDSAATRQAITTAPVIIAHPDRGVRVLFATGRLLNDADPDPVTGAGVNTIYGVHDRLDATLPDITKTQKRTLAERQYPDGQRVRVLGQASGDDDNDIWEVDLAGGERVLTDPLLDSGRLTVSVAQPLSPSGEVWLLELDAQRGTAPTQIVFDMNNDGVLDTHDTLATKGTEITKEDLIVGRFYGSGIGSGPVIANLSATRRATYINRKEATQADVSTCTTNCGTGNGDDNGSTLDSDSGGAVTNAGDIASDTGAVLTPPAPCGGQDCVMQPRTNPGRIGWKELLAP
jgi:type IV pilus assembly protein PilY1